MITIKFDIFHSFIFYLLLFQLKNKLINSINTKKIIYFLSINLQLEENVLQTISYQIIVSSFCFVRLLFYFCCPGAISSFILTKSSND
jgi:hypothetical protein